jgi:hypothetical protein
VDNETAPSSSKRSASILRYGGLFCVSHIAGVLVVGTLLRLVGFHMPWVGLWLPIAAGYLVSYVFARRERRHFTRAENWRLTLVSCLYLAVFSIYSDVVSRPLLPLDVYETPIGDKPFLDLVAIDCLLYVLVPLVFFEFGAPRAMRRYLDSLNTPNKRWSGRDA